MNVVKNMVRWGGNSWPPPMEDGDNNKKEKKPSLYYTYQNKIK